MSSDGGRSVTDAVDGDAIESEFEDAQQELVLQATDLSLRVLADMVETGAIDIRPQFQRRDRWDALKQSALIESFVLNIPVPPIYLAEDALGTFSVIDGKQRISAIRAFLSGELQLRGLSRFAALNKHRFGDLPRIVQHNLDMRPLRTVTLLRQSNPDLKFEVFHRLNSGGEILNAQEIRNVIYRGPLNDLIYELSGHEFLRRQLKIAGPKSPAFARMLDAEYVLRFLALARYWKVFGGDLSYSMSSYMMERRLASDTELSTLRRSFLRSIEACEAIWGRHAFRRPEGQGWRDQTLAGMYDAQMVAVSEWSDSTVDHLVKSKKGDRVVRNLFSDDTFDQAVRQATNTPSRVRYRIARMLEAANLE